MIANLLAFYAVKWDKISELEPAKILEPLFVILLALLFSLFTNSNLYETSSKIIYPALIACAALVFSHVKKHHLSFDKYFMAATLGSFFFGLELVVSRLILDYYSAFSFYFLRCFALFLLGLIILRPKIKRLDNKIYYQMVGLGIIWTVYRIVIYYGYLHLGVISTTLIFMLSPIFVYAFAWVFLKEKPSWRNIVSSIILIACVAYGTLVV
jgi:drug/metabolite transporter (DMT)-like permease